MKIDTFGLNIVKSKKGTVEYLSLFQSGVFTLYCAFYNWGVYRTVPAKASTDKHLSSALDFKGAASLSDKEKIKLLVDSSKRYLGVIDLAFDYKFMYEMDLDESEKTKLILPTETPTT